MLILNLKSIESFMTSVENFIEFFFVFFFDKVLRKNFSQESDKLIEKYRIVISQEFPY